MKVLHEKTTRCMCYARMQNSQAESEMERCDCCGCSILM